VLLWALPPDNDIYEELFISRFSTNWKRFFYGNIFVLSGSQKQIEKFLKEYINRKKGRPQISGCLMLYEDKRKYFQSQKRIATNPC
jgi:hypothetical protein